AKGGPVARKKPLDVARLNPLERRNKVGDAAPMMGIDHSDASIAEDIVTREEKVPEAERELPVRMPGCMPDLEGQVADGDRVPFGDLMFHTDRWHLEVDSLGLDGREGRNAIA